MGKRRYLGKLHNATMLPTHFNPKSAWYAHPAIMLKHIWTDWELLFWWCHKKHVWCQTTIAAHKTHICWSFSRWTACTMHRFPSSAYNVNFQSKMTEYKVSKWSNSPHPVPLHSYSRRKAGLARVPSGPRLVYRPLGCSSEWENDSRERCQPPTAWLPSLERLRTGHSHHKQTKYSVQEKKPHAKVKTTRWEMSSRYRRRGSSRESGQPHKDSHAFPLGLVRVYLQSFAFPHSPLM